jgi:hypothetical protein
MAQLISFLVAAALGTVLYLCVAVLAVFILGRTSIRLFGHPSALYLAWVRPVMVGYGWIVWLSIIGVLLYEL